MAVLSGLPFALQIAAAQKAPHPAFGHPLPVGEGRPEPFSPREKVPRRGG